MHVSLSELVLDPTKQLRNDHHLLSAELALLAEHLPKLTTAPLSFQKVSRNVIEHVRDHFTREAILSMPYKLPCRIVSNIQLPTFSMSMNIKGKLFLLL